MELNNIKAVDLVVVLHDCPEMQRESCEVSINQKPEETYLISADSEGGLVYYV